MTATPKLSIPRFKTKLSALKRARQFVRWGESSGFARELQHLLNDLRSTTDDPRSGAELVAAFYETDDAVFNRCDDSSGHVGDVFRHDAKELFIHYASHCTDKDWLADLVLQLNRDDGYGVRDALIHCAKTYLPEPTMRAMVARMGEMAGKEDNEYRKRRWLLGIESLARQLKDAPLFAKTRIAAWGSLSTAACTDIARVFLESGDPATALEWLERVPEQETYQAHERDELLLEIHGALGNNEQRISVAWRIFRRHRSAASLDRLVTTTGSDRTTVIASEVMEIDKMPSLSYADAAFLVEVGRIDDAERYLLDHAKELNGNFYGSLLPLAQQMEAKGRILTASVIYRALLDSILFRARPATYAHGASYLKILDRLAVSVSDWRDFENHTCYTKQLHQQHGRKTAFWSRYRS